VFGCIVGRIDFGRNDYVELVLVISNSNQKWFVFGYIHVKVSLTIKMCVKINSRINFGGRINSTRQQPNISESILVCRSGTKHTRCI